MLICVTNRKMCQDDFLERLDQIAQGKPLAILLREKDLSLAEYKRLAESVRDICLKHGVPLIINKYKEAAADLKCYALHLSMPDLRKYRNEIKKFSCVGASVHSVSEAEEAERLGAAYLIAGHIFPTECKKGVPPRGLSFLRDVCSAVEIPVYAIGGITEDRVKDVLGAGARGVCVMSEAMTCSHPAELASRFRS
ncbi:MAG TPA: thiamine phosphate synthase [Bacillota bacterium]|nr:thiamine phosphate synthase [Peptococcaceae bacterium MAG4]NLW37390.1 thiamine phosphate synthase [Peptococcaceae bacterium]HPZ44097.1 thiamine phosphate synthase [Bacillota bacterium]HQD76626.1 thiamine phosphate synthase [Bacillota bacterium]HUM59335.1 thiamine phosphate synthase [Bacillota bacterium]